MEKATLNGVELQYEVTGSGEPVLFISPGPITDGFLPLVNEEALARFRLIRYRQRRIGSGTNGDAAMSFVQHAADAAALLGHLGIARAHIAGHSTGADIALQLAADRPDLVHTLALLEPLLLFVPGAPAFLEKAAPALTAYAAGDRAEAMRSFLCLASSLDWTHFSALIEQHVPGGVAQALNDADNVFAGYVPALDAWQFGRDQTARITQPVLSVLGTSTDPLFIECNDLLHAWFPQLEVCRIADVAHLLQLQNPEPVARGLAGFFTRHPITRESSSAQHATALQQ